MSEPMIIVRDLTSGWPGAVLQEHVSFEVERGDIFVILGGSGSGKSTMLRYLVGLEQPLTGEIVLCTRTRCTPSQRRGDDQRPVFGVMFQSGALLGSMTVGENVSLPLEQWTALPADAIGAVVEAKLRLVGLRGVETKLPSQLSGGMIKRAAIARAMALEPELMFLDEPSAGLDPITAAALDDLILTLNATLGLTVVMVTHDLASIFKVGKHCIMLDRESKGIIARGDPRELREHCLHPRVRAFFQRASLEQP